MKKIQIIFSLARDVFPYALLSYLVLFLLENLFPGFVSNNFSLNWVLVVVLVFGLLAAFAPEVPETPTEKPIGKNDYLLIAILGVVGGAVIFAKLEMDLVLRWATTLVSGALIILVGFVTLIGGDEQTEEIEQGLQGRPEYIGAPASGRPHVLMILKRIVRPFLLYRVKLPLAYVLLFTLVTAFLIPKNIVTLTNTLRRPVPAPSTETAQPVPASEPFFWDDVNQFVPIPPSNTLLISVLNGGGESGAAASFSAILRDYGFGRVVTGNADRYDYTNAQIRFLEADKPQANIIKQLLLNEYPLIMEMPADATAGGITVILGTKEKTQ